MNPPTKNKEKQKTKNQSEDPIPSFIRKTYEILEEGRYVDVVRWSDDGTAIIINNPTEFAHKVLPAYFKHNNLTSFIRQLNMYDFHKKRSLNMDHVYCHEKFQKGKKHLLKEIRRKSSENSSQNSEKGLLKLESPQSRQDLAAVVHEVKSNVLLKKYNGESLSRVTLLESKIQEMTFEYQTLWSQIYQFKEKESILKNVIVNLLKQSGLPLTVLPPFLQSELDFSLLGFKPQQEQKENDPGFGGQTTTKMYYTVPNSTFPQTYMTPPQQEIQKDMRLTPMQVVQPMQNEFTMGNIAQPLYLDNFNKGKTNEQQQAHNLVESKFPVTNLEINRSAQNLENWNLNFETFRPVVPENDRTAQTRTEENTNPDFNNLGKRKLNNQKDDNGTINKKVKQNPLGLSDINARPKLIKKDDPLYFQSQNNQFNMFSMSGNMSANNKDEGRQKENN